MKKRNSGIKMFKLDTITHFINTKFRNKIVGVEPPRENWFMDNLESYTVTVKYKYTEPKDVIFWIENDEDLDPDFSRYPEDDQKWFREFSRKESLRCAEEFYSQTLKQIQQQKGRKRHENTK